MTNEESPFEQIGETAEISDAVTLDVGRVIVVSNVASRVDRKCYVVLSDRSVGWVHRVSDEVLPNFFRTITTVA